MGQAFSIWSPVVIAELSTPRKLAEQSTFELKHSFRSMEDLKIKEKSLEIKIQGQAAETQIRVDILALLGDLSGNRHLINQEKIIRDRVPFCEFNNDLGKEKKLKFIGDVQKIFWDGEIDGSVLKVNLFVDYMIIATREQLVKLSENEQGEVKGKALQEALRELENEVSRVEKKNEELRHKIFYYERDLSSLKRGISKAEKNNALMNKEIDHYQDLLQELQFAIKEKDRRITFYENANIRNPYYHEKESGVQDSEDKDIRNVGKRIKRMFMNSL